MTKLMMKNLATMMMIMIELSILTPDMMIFTMGGLVPVP